MEAADRLAVLPAERGDILDLRYLVDDGDEVAAGLLSKIIDASGWSGTA